MGKRKYIEHPELEATIQVPEFRTRVRLGRLVWDRSTIIQTLQYIAGQGLNPSYGMFNRIGLASLRGGIENHFPGRLKQAMDDAGLTYKYSDRASGALNEIPFTEDQLIDRLVELRRGGVRLTFKELESRGMSEISYAIRLLFGAYGIDEVRELVRQKLNEQLPLEPDKAAALWRKMRFVWLNNKLQLENGRGPTWSASRIVYCWLQAKYQLCDGMLPDPRRIEVFAPGFRKAVQRYLKGDYGRLDQIATACLGRNARLRFFQPRRYSANEDYWTVPSNFGQLIPARSSTWGIARRDRAA